MRSPTLLALGSIALLTLVLPDSAGACACGCGCGVFQVGTGSMLPTTLQNGTTLFAQFDYMNQGKNWSGNSLAPTATRTSARCSRRSACIRC